MLQIHKVAKSTTLKIQPTVSPTAMSRYHPWSSTISLEKSQTCTLRTAALVLQAFYDWSQSHVLSPPPPQSSFRFNPSVSRLNSGLSG